MEEHLWSVSSSLIDHQDRSHNSATLTRRGRDVLFLERFPTPDIPHGLSHFHAYSAIEPLIGFSKELKQVLVLLGEIEHQGPLPRYAQ